MQFLRYGENMKANYKNWFPLWMVLAIGGGFLVALSLYYVFGIWGLFVSGFTRTVLTYVFGILSLVLLIAVIWAFYAYRAFSYEGGRKMSKQIIDGVSDYVHLPAGGKGLDVGCGSGALTIACARKNPQGFMFGIDKWGKEYHSYNKELCENNASAEGAYNTEFSSGDAVNLDFPDEYFDAVTSNYVYHNIHSVDKQDLLLETLRVLKKGGCFAIHDIMGRAFGDMEEFAQKLRESGFEDVQLIKTDEGMFMNPKEARIITLKGSTLLFGRK